MAEGPLEELDALRSIYCKPGEFQEQTCLEGRVITITFEIGEQTSNNLKECGLNFLIPHNYPQSPLQNMSVFCNSDSMTTQKLSSLQQDAEQKLREMKEESYMLLEFCCFVHDCIKNSLVHFVPPDNSCSLESTLGTCLGVSSTSNEINKVSSDVSSHSIKDNECDNTHHLLSSASYPTDSDQSLNLVTSVLQLDHMRSKANYIKLIKKWTAELSLNGRLIFCKKFIFIILQGRSEDVKNYVIRNRTVNVDVDSRGRSCKERLLNILCETPSKHHAKFMDFSVLDDIPSIDGLISLFKSFHMETIYRDYISSSLSNQSKRSSKK